MVQPFSRETIVDRRQPVVRWSAVFAGALAGITVWLILELLCLGTALSVIDPDRVGTARSFALGTTLWSLIVPLIAMFVGGLLAGRLAGYTDHRFAGLHGLLVGAVTAVLGVLAIVSSLDSLAPSSRTQIATVGPTARADLERALAPANARLHDRGKHEISVDDFVGAVHASQNPNGTVNTDTLANRLAEETGSTRADTDEALRSLGKTQNDVIAEAQRLGERRYAVMTAAQRAGNGLLGAGVTLLLAIAAAIGGALLAARHILEGRNGGAGGRERRTHTTAPYPIPTTPPPGSPAPSVPPGSTPPSDLVQ
jgi:hypothetical protein